MGSDWDIEKLADLVGELSALPDFDVTLTGFDERDVAHLMLAPDAVAKRASSGDAEGAVGRVEVVLEVPLDEWEAAAPRSMNSSVPAPATCARPETLRSMTLRYRRR